MWPFAHRKGLQEKDKVWLLREQKRKKKLRKLLKRLQNNDTCSMPGLTCFTHDNQHWQTAPLWTREQARGPQEAAWAGGASPGPHLAPLPDPTRSFGNRFSDIRGRVLPTGLRPRGPSWTGIPVGRMGFFLQAHSGHALSSLGSGALLCLHQRQQQHILVHEDNQRDPQLPLL